jgi:hypothetical protein
MPTITITYPADARTPHAEAAALAQRAAESAAVAVLRACALGDMATAQALVQRALLAAAPTNAAMEETQR